VSTLGDLKLALLGGLDLSLDGNPPRLIPISSKKARALLAYTAMHPEQGVDRDRLASLFWGDRSDELAYHNLRQCLHLLRTELASLAPGLLVLDGRRVGLKTGTLAVDALDFVALSQSAEAQELERALGLYQGRFLAGLKLEVEAFDDWAQAERARLEAVAGRVFEICVERYEALGNGQKAIETATRLVELDPLREDWQRALLRLYARYRSSEAALAHARTLTALLRKQLDVDPAPTTKAVIAEIRSRAIAPSDRQGGPSPLSAAGMRQNRLQPSRSLPSKPSIAVLPFANMSSGPELEYFADGITEEIILNLSRLQWLSVIARNSSFTYKGRPVDVRQVAFTLGSRYVLEGSVRVAANRVRVAAGLVDGMTGQHVWNESYDGEFASVIAVQDEIAERVVGAIAPQVFAAECVRARGRSAESLDSWECVVRALAIINSRSKSDLNAARKLLNRSLAMEPNHVKAYSLLSYVTTLDTVAGWAPRGSTSEPALDFGRKAVLLDADEPWAHLALGFVYAWRGWAEEAAIEYQQALKLDPHLAYGHTLLGAALCYLGRGDEALIQVDKAQSIGPKDLFTRGNRGVNNQTRAIAYFVAGRYREGIQFGRTAIIESPTLPTAYRMLVANCALADEFVESRATLHALKRLVPGTSLESIKEWMPFNRPADRQYLIDAFRVVGLR
jgi:TolB-like protein/DNA-binding SARP family transcriptional activator